MRADIQRKPLGFQEVTASHYRCVVFCVAEYHIILEIVLETLVFKTK